MNNKEKELLAQYIFTIFADNGVSIDNDIIDKLADGLIARGWVKMPCNVGGKIYYANIEIEGKIRQPKSTKTWVSSHKIKDDKDCIQCAFQILIGDAFKTKEEALVQCKEWEKEYKNESN